MLKKHLCIDYGTRKSGLAYSVEGFAFAWKTIPTATLLAELPKLIREKDIQAIIVGMPYHIDGSMSKHGKRVEKFVESIQTVTSLPVITHDERLTTSEARIGFSHFSPPDRGGRGVGFSAIDGDIDAESARLILEDYLRG